MQPLVSVICLCYNHARFLEEALDSVRQQTYNNLEIIVVDDASTDNSPQMLKAYAQQYPEIKLLLHDLNTGNCRAFNEALALCHGKYVIDFATDDVMYPEKIGEQVAAFELLDQSYGVIYTDAELIDDHSKTIGFFYKRDADGEITSRTPSGYVFTDILSYAFLCPPTLMFRKALLDELQGYDETLAYEDFDIWVRSAQQYQYHFLDKILMKRRVHPDSLSHQLYQPGDKQLASTIKICRKAQKLIRSEEEKKALIIRVKSEIRQAFSTENFAETLELLKLLQELTSIPFVYQIIGWLSRRQFRIGRARRLYYSYIYGK